MKPQHFARIAATAGALLFTLAHLLPLSGFDDAAFFSVRNDSFSASGVSGPHHLIARLYFSFGWILALVIVVLAVAAVITASKARRALSAGALIAGVGFLTTIAAQAFIDANVPVIAMGALGALIVAGAGFMPTDHSSTETAGS